MKNIFSLLVVALLSFALYIPPANASIVGLYFYFQSSGDRLSVFMRDGKPFLKIEVPKFIDLPQCQGFQLYRFAPFKRTNLKLVKGDKRIGTGFPLWLSRDCLEAGWVATEGGKRAPTRNLVQEIDIYKDFFAHFTNREELIRGFKAEEFFLAVMHQVNYDGFETTRREVFYTHKEVMVGKVLLGSGSTPQK